MTRRATMKSEPTPVYQKREHLSVSTLLDFARCPRLYFYKKSGIIPKKEPAAAIYGQAMHRALPIALNDDLSGAIEAFISLWDTSLDTRNRNTERAVAQLDDFWRTRAGGRGIYTLMDPPEGTIPRDDKTSPYEVGFAIDVGLSVPIIGYLDAFARHRDNGEVWPLDFKTAGRFTTNLFDGLDTHPQCLTYTLAATVFGFEPRGLLYDFILCDPKKTETRSHFAYVQEHRLPGILEWLRLTGESLLQMEQMIEEEDPAAAFPRDFSGCVPYTSFYLPGWKCDYANLCMAPDWRYALPLYDVVLPEDPPNGP
jgi:RecB family exonuclease